MNNEILLQLFERDLLKLKKEIEAYNSEDAMWKIDKNITNSGGNLCLHLIGNLKTYIGASLANTGYQRNREFEFAGKGVSKEELIEGIVETIEVVKKGIGNLKESDMDKDYPVVIWKSPTHTQFTLIHLHSHLNYHLGQINYHRRFFDVEI